MGVRRLRVIRDGKICRLVAEHEVARGLRRVRRDEADGPRGPAGHRRQARRAQGYAEQHRMTRNDRKDNHAEIDMSSSVVMIGNPGPNAKNPKHLGGTNQLTYVYVDDVDQHYEHAKAAGATITREPEDQFYGDRTYGAEDPEGHRWHFAQHVRDVSEEDAAP